MPALSPHTNKVPDVGSVLADSVEILAFDVFGTVVDWHSGVAREVAALNLGVDADAFASAWRDGYKPAMQRILAGALAWMPIDELHRLILEEVLLSFGVSTLTEAQKKHLNKAWHRLDPWPDTIEALHRLKARYMLCTLSNGNLGLLANMAKYAGLPWDCILSAEIFRTYKPDPEMYLGTARLFDVPPDRILMVAAHQDDLAAARACGLKTAYIERPRELGPMRTKDTSSNPDNSLHAVDLLDLAVQLNG